MWVGPQKVPIKSAPPRKKQKQVDPHARGCRRSWSSYKWHRVDPHVRTNVAPHLASGLAANCGTLSLCNLRHSRARDNGPFSRWPVGQTSNTARTHRRFFNWFRPSNVAQKPNPGLCNNDKSALQTIATTKGKFFGSCNTIICCLDWQWEQSLWPLGPQINHRTPAPIAHKMQCLVTSFYLLWLRVCMHLEKRSFKIKDLSRLK